MSDDTTIVCPVCMHELDMLHVITTLKAQLEEKQKVIETLQNYSAKGGSANKSTFGSQNMGTTEFGIEMEDIRIMARMNVKEICEAMGFNESTYRNWRRGRNNSFGKETMAKYQIFKQKILLENCTIRQMDWKYHAVNKGRSCFGRNLEQARINAHLTRKQLCTIMETTESGYRGWIHSIPTTNINRKALKKIEAFMLEHGTDE